MAAEGIDGLRDNLGDVSITRSTDGAPNAPGHFTRADLAVSTASETLMNLEFRDSVYACPSPKIISLSPSSGAVGDSVTISGSGFGKTQGTGKVTFNGKTATVTNWADTEIKTTVPTSATTGNVVVELSNGVKSNGVMFTVAGRRTLCSVEINALNTAWSGKPARLWSTSYSAFGNVQGTVFNSDQCTDPLDCTTMTVQSSGSPATLAELKVHRVDVEGKVISDLKISGGPAFPFDLQSNWGRQYHLSGKSVCDVTTFSGTGLDSYSCVDATWVDLFCANL